MVKKLEDQIAQLQVELATLREQKPVAWLAGTWRKYIDGKQDRVPLGAEVSFVNFNWAGQIPLYAAPLVSDKAGADSNDAFYAGLYLKSSPMWRELHDLAVSKGYDHVRYAIECAPVYKCDCMGARKVALDLEGRTIPCECAAGANDAALNPLAADVVQAWIPISERLPEVGDLCLIRIPVCGHFEVEGAKYKGDGDWLGAWCGTRGRNQTYKVSHWLPARALLATRREGSKS